ncbi:cysteine desulfurase family protein [Desulfosoma caldarium]|uniref:cysteine desulfurase n=2 Tax=Desulfosoma caldarium TaxID=610254 RepID=A0A3N1VFP1_9BACT|nr:cysteine desulfurase family protein [Desulfosoma caldarium]
MNMDTPQGGRQSEIYLDHAATSFPKPKSVVAEVTRAVAELASPGRGQSRRAMWAEAMVREARDRAARFFAVPEPSRLVFTKSATESLNMALKGFLKKGHRVLTSSMEHNAVARPLARLAEERAVEIIRVPCFADGSLNLDALRRALDPPPALAVFVHASNVNGALVATPKVLSLCREAGVPVVLDAAQTAGLLPISVVDHDLGMLACSGHKGLLGPSGIGVLYIRSDLQVEPLIEGGTGSHSEQWVQPREMPEAMESGTPNIPGIAGLQAGLECVSAMGLETLQRHELGLADDVAQRLQGIKGVQVYRPSVRGGNAVSFTVEGMAPHDVAAILAEAGIAVRAGLHCAPWAHETLGTYPTGTVRVSPGWCTTREDLDAFTEIVDAMLTRRRRRHLGRA